MRYQAALLLSIALASPARADEWTRTDTTAQAAFTAVVAFDWMQTINFTQHGVPRALRDGTRDVHLPEMNPLLGSSPSRTRVNLMITASLIAHAAISYALPHPYRTVWQSIGIGIEIAAVSNNARNGVSLSMPWN